MKSRKSAVILTAAFIAVNSLLLQGCDASIKTIKNGIENSIDKSKTESSFNTETTTVGGGDEASGGEAVEVKQIEAKPVDKPINVKDNSYITSREQLEAVLTANLETANDTSFRASKELIDQGIDKLAINIAETSGFGGYISNVEYTISGDKVSLHFNYKDSKDKFLSKIALVKKRVVEIAATVIKSGMTDYQKELALHDYVINNTSYDVTGLKNGNVSEDDYTAYGVLVNKTAVCEGYSEIMYRLLRQAGVDNMIVIGKGNGNPHSWNLVNIGGQYYHLDSTFDDPVTDSGSVLTYNYFNVTDAQISKDHSWDNSSYPRSTATAANYYVKSGLYASNKTEFYNIIKTSLEKKKTVIRCKVSTNDTNTYKKDIIYTVVNDNNLNYVDLSKGYTFSYDPNYCTYEFYIKYK